MRTGAHCRYHVVDAAMRGLHDHGNVKAGLADFRQNTHAVEAGHDEVKHHRIDRGRIRAGQQGYRRVSAVHHHRFIAAFLHHVFDQPALYGVVVRDQDAGSHGFPPTLHYLSRIGAIWLTPINALLNPTVPASIRFGSTQVSNQMTSRNTSALRKSNAGKSAAKSGNPKKATSKTGKLPEWNLDDLYAGIDAPEIARDLQRMDSECVTFETDYKGKLAEHTANEGGGKWLAEAVRRYEAIDDLAGRLGSYAGLIHAGDNVDPVISKFYGDVSERLTNASLHLLFFSLELNRIDDAVIENAMQAAELAHYRPWIEDQRKDKPYQLEDRVEQLFHEKSQSGYAAWNRLFDQTISTLRFEVSGKELAIEPTLNLLQDRDDKKRKVAADALAKTFKANERTFTLVTNTLAKDKEISDRWRGFKDVADSRHLNNRVEREVVDALVASVRAAYPKLSHRYYRLKAGWFKKKKLAHWDRNAPLPFAATGTIAWPEAQDMVLAAKNGALMAPTPLTLAETASVFGEMLTFKRLLSQTKNAKQRQALLAGKVEDMINTVVRQIAFYSFERAVHIERKNGELTAERIGPIWLSVQGESLGLAIEIKPGYENFWMYIPHFIHSPFYVYAYAFGDCLVNSLYAVYEHAADGFADRYLDMLAAGGTRHYSELLQPFGLDAKDPKFWDGGLSVISGMIDELETMG